MFHPVHFYIFLIYPINKWSETSSSSPLKKKNKNKEEVSCHMQSHDHDSFMLEVHRHQIGKQDQAYHVLSLTQGPSPTSSTRTKDGFAYELPTPGFFAIHTLNLAVLHRVNLYRILTSRRC